MNVDILKSISRRAAFAGLAVTAVVVAGALGVAGAEVRSVPGNSVNSLKIVNNSVASIDIKNGTVAGVDIANNSVASIDLANGSVAGVDIADDSVTGADIAFNTIESSDISDETITDADIADQAVGSNEITDGSIIRNDVNPLILPWFAHVDGGATATVLDSTAFSGATATRTGTGVYQVGFAFSMSDCGWTATRTANAANAASPGFITVEQGPSATTLVVRTFDTSGAPADTADDQGFTVLVSC